MPEGPEIRRAADRVAAAIEGRVADDVFFAFDELKEFEIALGRREYAQWEARKGESSGRIAELRGTMGECDGVLGRAERDGMGVRTERHDKEEALAKIAPLDSAGISRYRPGDRLLQFLNSL